jgi:3,4-dihydroxy 2-butanone 4-phosphate synthase/GTP cyclohydrolase II
VADSLKNALSEIRSGRTLLLLAEEGARPEGMLCCAAEQVTPEAIAFMAVHGRGLVCLVITPERMRKLGIRLLASDQGQAQPAFGASFEARQGVTTGISASDRATTIRTALAEDAGPEHIVMPGHVIPVQACPGGVLARPDLFEGALDLVRLAGCKPAAVGCTVLAEDGEVAAADALTRLAREQGLCVVNLGDIVAERLRSETLVRRVGEAELPTTLGGSFRAIVYANSIDRHEHMALVSGELDPDTDVLVRVHSQCLTGDVLGSERCDCGDQLRKAVDIIGAAGSGVIVYMHQEGRGIGLANKLRAYALQDQGRDTVEANLELGFKEDHRNYGVAAQILRDLGVRSIRLLTNNPRKLSGLERYGIRVVERMPLEVPPRPGNIQYLRVKQEKMGHLLTSLRLGR